MFQIEVYDYAFARLGSHDKHLTFLLGLVSVLCSSFQCQVSVSSLVKFVKLEASP